LLLLAGCSLRGLVPAGSPRARIALRPSAWREFAGGVIPYQAGAAGVVRVTVRRPGRPVLMDRTATTNGGLGQLRSGRALPRGRYDVHLVLMTPAGGVTQTRARIDTRRRLRWRKRDAPSIASSAAATATMVTGGRPRWAAASAAVVAISRAG
jgi:hypothetical protein